MFISSAEMLKNRSGVDVFVLVRTLKFDLQHRGFRLACAGVVDHLAGPSFRTLKKHGSRFFGSCKPPISLLAAVYRLTGSAYLPQSKFLCVLDGVVIEKI